MYACVSLLGLAEWINQFNEIHWLIDTQTCQLSPISEWDSSNCPIQNQAQSEKVWENYPNFHQHYIWYHWTKFFKKLPHSLSQMIIISLSSTIAHLKLASLEIPLNSYHTLMIKVGSPVATNWLVFLSNSSTYVLRKGKWGGSYN